MVVSGTFSLEFFLDLLSQHLAQFDTPLVEAVDVPDDTLCEDHVLVISNQRTESAWSDHFGQDVGRRSVAQKGLVSNQLIWGTLSFDFIRGLADHESFSLSEEVGCQHSLVQSAFDGIVRLSGQDEVGGDEFGALMQQLEERVLCIGGRFTEEDGTGRVLDVVACSSDCLAIRLHGQLLQVGRESVHVLVERCNKVSLGAKEVRVPDTKQAANDWNVLMERGSPEMVVHGMSAGKELVEVVITNVQAH